MRRINEISRAKSLNLDRRSNHVLTKNTFEIPKETEMYSSGSDIASLNTVCTTQQSLSSKRKQSVKDIHKRTSVLLSMHPKKKKVSFKEVTIIPIPSYKKHNLAIHKGESINKCLCLIF